MCCKLFCLKNQRQGVGERKQPQKPMRDNLLERAVEVTVDLDLSVGEPSPDRLSPLAQAGLPAATPHHTTHASSAGSSSCPAPQAQRWKSLCLHHPGTAGWLAAATLPYAERWNHPAVPQKKLFAIAKSESVLWRCPFRSLWKQKQLSPKKKKKTNHVKLTLLPERGSFRLIRGNRLPILPCCSGTSPMSHFIPHFSHHCSSTANTQAPGNTFQTHVLIIS